MKIGNLNEKDIDTVSDLLESVFKIALPGVGNTVADFLDSLTEIENNSAESLYKVKVLTHLENIEKRLEALERK